MQIFNSEKAKVFAGNQMNIKYWVCSNKKSELEKQVPFKIVPSVPSRGELNCAVVGLLL